jgi:hypothetical protein
MMEKQLRSKMCSLTWLRRSKFKGAFRLRSYNKMGMDHVVLVKVASTAVVSQLLKPQWQSMKWWLARVTPLMALGVFRYVLMKPAFESSINKAHLTTPLIVVFNDRTKLNEVVVEYPIGHARRRTEEISLLHEKFKRNLSRILRKVSVAGPSSVLRSLFIL